MRDTWGWMPLVGLSRRILHAVFAVAGCRGLDDILYYIKVRWQQGEPRKDAKGLEIGDAHPSDPSPAQ